MSFQIRSLERIEHRCGDTGLINWTLVCVRVCLCVSNKLFSPSPLELYRPILFHLGSENVSSMNVNVHDTAILWWLCIDRGNCHVFTAMWIIFYRAKHSRRGQTHDPNQLGTVHGYQLLLVVTQWNWLWQGTNSLLPSLLFHHPSLPACFYKSPPTSLRKTEVLRKTDFQWRGKTQSYMPFHGFSDCVCVFVCVYKRVFGLWLLWLGWIWMRTIVFPHGGLPRSPPHDDCHVNPLREWVQDCTLFNVWWHLSNNVLFTLWWAVSSATIATTPISFYYGFPPPCLVPTLIPIITLW